MVMLDADQQNKLRRYFSLAFLSYIGDVNDAFGDERSRLTRIRQVLESGGINDLQENYRVVWGPVIRRFSLANLNFPRRNTMFVLHNEAENEYVISIAGTNPTSLFGWFVEDFEVADTVSWMRTHNRAIHSSRDQKKEELTRSISTKIRATYAESESSDVGGSSPRLNASNSQLVEEVTRVLFDDSDRIALGTFVGLTKLSHAKTDLDVMPIGEPSTLLQFFKEQFKNSTNKARIIVTGHSLGGTLAPVLALWLHEQKDNWAPKDRHDDVSVYSYSYAGATPGNQEFPKRFHRAFDVGTDHSRAFHVWNELDVVPHAWTPDGLDQIEDLYSPPYPQSSFWKSATVTAIKAATGQSKTYAHCGTSVRLRSNIPRWRNLFPLINLPLPGVPLAKHLGELIFQHSIAYFAALDININAKAMKAILPITRWIPFSASALSHIFNHAKASSGVTPLKETVVLNDSHSLIEDKQAA